MSDDAKPWGDDFDAERAWALIQRLRTEKAELAERVTVAETTAAEAHEKLVGVQTAMVSAQARAAAAEKLGAELQRQASVGDALRRYKVPDEYADFLTGTTAEEIDAQAARLARRPRETRRRPHVPSTLRTPPLGDRRGPDRRGAHPGALADRTLPLDETPKAHPRLREAALSVDLQGAGRLRRRPLSPRPPSTPLDP